MPIRDRTAGRGAETSSYGREAPSHVAMACPKDVVATVTTVTKRRQTFWAHPESRGCAASWAKPWARTWTIVNARYVRARRPRNAVADLSRY